MVLIEMITMVVNHWTHSLADDKIDITSLMATYNNDDIFKNNEKQDIEIVFVLINFGSVIYLSLQIVQESSINNLFWGQ